MRSGISIRVEHSKNDLTLLPCVPAPQSIRQGALRSPHLEGRLPHHIFSLSFQKKALIPFLPTPRLSSHHEGWTAADADADAKHHSSNDSAATQPEAKHRNCSRDAFQRGNPSIASSHLENTSLTCHHPRVRLVSFSTTGKSLSSTSHRF